MKRKGKSKHDKTVRRVAGGYKSQGWKVRADNVKGYKDPKPIRGRVPDVVARKSGKTRVVEVETKGSMRADRKQREVFKKYTSKSKKRKFRTKIA